MFKEFTRLDESRTRRFEGAGMGLAIVQGLVDLFGGEIAVDSRVGEGTTFAVTIPVKPVAPSAAVNVAARAKQRGARPQVLVVDDNELVRESLCEMVEHMGYDGAAAASADDALAWLDARHCDVILLDLQMPAKDGYAFMKDYVAGGALSQRTPVISVSAYASDMQTRAGAEMFFDCLMKPVHYEVLRDAVQRALAARDGAAANV